MLKSTLEGYSNVINYRSGNLRTACQAFVTRGAFAINYVNDQRSYEAGEIKPKRRIMELHVLGAEIREGIDAQEYVNKLHSE